MYRAATLKVLRAGIPTGDAARVAALIEASHVELRDQEGHQTVLLDGEDVSDAIRTPDVTRAVSAVSSVRRVRDVMVREQRRMGRDGGIVLEGRDIGSVVFPNADLKFFLVAGIDARAMRRNKELEERGIPADLEGLRDELRERDRMDSTRAESPLVKPSGAVEIDTSDLTIEQQVAFVVESARRMMEGREST